MKLLKSTIVKKMATLSLAVGGLFGATRAFGDDFGYVSVPTTAVYQVRSIDEMRDLTAPIALYPDALLTQVLVASTYPNDVLAAAQYLQNGGDPALAGGYGWDDSVVGLLQTPDVLYQLANNVDWMNQLGDTFLNQQPDVFAAVQSLRVKAQTCGNLVSNDRCQVITTDSAIEIVPADPQIIYVPRYDPQIVYVQRPIDYYHPCISYDSGIRVGFWLHADYDWCDHRVYVGNWGGDRPWWHYDRGFDRRDYVRNRPGVYVNNVTNVTNVRNSTNIRNVNVVNNTTVWSRDSHKAAPRHIDGPVINNVRQVTNVNNRVTNNVARVNNRVNNRVTNNVTSVASDHRSQSTVRTVTNNNGSTARSRNNGTFTNPGVSPSRPTHTEQPAIHARSEPATTHRSNPSGPAVTERKTTPVNVPAVHSTRHLDETKSNAVTAPVRPAQTAQPVVQSRAQTTSVASHTVQTSKPVSLPTRAAQPNPVRQPAARPVPTHSSQSIARTPEKKAPAPATHSAPSVAARNTTTVSHSSPAPSSSAKQTAGRPNGNNSRSAHHG